MTGRIKNKAVFFACMLVLLLMIVLLSLLWGQINVPVTAALAVIGKQLHLTGAEGVAVTQEQVSVIWHIRMPRTLVGILVGAALAVSGAVMQGVFGNSLADPGIIGVSSGAALGAVIAIALGVTASGIFYMPFFALAGALLAVGLTVFLAMRDGKIPVMVLLLAGVAVSMLLGALTSGILTFMNEYRLREFLFWMVGGLDYRRWDHVYLAVGPVVIGILILCLLARHLNILALGEQEARAVGVSVAFFRLLLLVVAAVTTATAVCVSGTIGFVGLVVPHIMRLLLGPEHRTLLPACALAGGLFLVACDTLGRIIMPPSEIRVGIMTALVGAPYFLYLLRKAQKGGGLS
ncbi:FecCD family ABC transporter permease [Sporomusa acidovorans]|uniref:Hemin transport system permease protein HmuU n=1 Tax=Sporomusa acidovorans (strain ATCC 49682 / DSM 3132 / Mol) TaxID=1123286 RepID=A0ABZ3IZ62_SPOA4|nr:iron ABC transporter permease [Sporomusa acidovorans]OZC17636.1 hemin transport system permease protein HmuU [Sporomusa acidovorans DSM 3132]SDE10241.1 iron complex transport system permease protein [Sporomusa acidovorans]